jgi:CheY-like chemotaxis protein
MSDGGYRVILVEDNDDDADLVARGVKRFGSNVGLERFSTIPSAIEYLVQARDAGSRIDLVLVDGKIGGMEAIEFFRMAGDEDLSHLPCVVLTGVADARVSERLLAVGALHVRSKPTDYAEFQEELKRILSEFCR